MSLRRLKALAGHIAGPVQSALLILLLCLWCYICTISLNDAGAPYQCGSDYECEVLHGVE